MRPPWPQAQPEPEPPFPARTRPRPHPAAPRRACPGRQQGALQPAVPVSSACGGETGVICMGDDLGRSSDVIPTLGGAVAAMLYLPERDTLVVITKASMLCTFKLTDNKPVQASAAPPPNLPRPRPLSATRTRHVAHPDVQDPRHSHPPSGARSLRRRSSPSVAMALPTCAGAESASLRTSPPTRSFE